MQYFGDSGGYDVDPRVKHQNTECGLNLVIATYTILEQFETTIDELPTYFIC